MANISQRSHPRELATQIGKSEQWMSGMLRILELPARLQEELRHTPGIGFDMAQRIAQNKKTYSIKLTLGFPHHFVAISAL